MPSPTLFAALRGYPASGGFKFRDKDAGQVWRADSWGKCPSRQVNGKGGGHVGLLELLLVVIVLAAIFGGIGVSPLLWLLLLVALVVFLTRGGFGYRRGGRI